MFSSISGWVPMSTFLHPQLWQWKSVWTLLDIPWGGQNHPRVTTSALIQVWAWVSPDDRTGFTKKRSTYNVCEYSRPHKINHFCNLENIHSIFILQLLGQGGKGTQHSCWNCSIPWRGEKKKKSYFRFSKGLSFSKEINIVFLHRG